MDLGLRGRRAAVAASSAGLGLATAQALAGEGCRVVISGRDPDRLELAAATASGLIPVRADVSGAAGAEKFVTDARAALGRIDILVVNAGGPPDGGYESFEPDDYLAAVQLNLMSAVAMCYAVTAEMRERRWGRILAITSVTVRHPLPGLILSNTARAGATGFLKTLATELAADGVTVNSIQPGLHDTARLRSVWGDRLDEVTRARVPAGRLGAAEDFGRVAALLCSEWASYLTGAAVPVDGGLAQGLQ
ncbi:MAG: SDR family oxidoreductase [bacterium]|nr:SDR family oxidoreductase [bacterium]MDE0669654.1 SDR family oxidoreductase [bacterium]